MASASLHETVLQREAIDALAIKSGGTYIDATFGRGGHSKAILEQLTSEGKLIAIDRDPDAIEVAMALQHQDSRLEVVQGTFRNLADLESTLKVRGEVDGILFDLGVSSPQLDNPQRGFSFLKDGPLDMRMNPMDQMSASEWVNNASEKEIADVLFQYGEERHSRRMAKRIVEIRSEAAIETTAELAEIIKAANPSWEKEKHPATRAFQAIRIKINDELEQLTVGLEAAIELLKPGGRLAVISFHSLEDRIVKKYFASESRGDSFPRDLPVTTDQLSPSLKRIGKPVRASKTEVTNNPRARSAVMRVAEKLT